ncbi:LbtU family siderophore porin [Halochromatium glycolicum]|uniref:LbtU family siderophore porin n=1 Tax=Halochromatium glycolicum TaxID=85075 RepID=A0AAJ0U655_9GAMM|nr:LbtU family siderophore porin [Halochromatium glycolicum]MBK1706013.1 hypothetical protein [Halochromatium glycolicum]
MRQQPLAAAIVAIFATAGGPAVGQTLEERVRRLEQENREQAAAIDQQRRTIEEQKQQLEGTPQRVEQLEDALATQRGADPGVGAGWFDRIEIAGLIEVEGSYVDPYEGGSESDLTLATFELGLAAQVTDWVEATASLLYEEGETDLEVDLAQITIANAEVSPVYFTAGQFYLPFGAYETNLVSDPLTLEIGEIRESAAEVGFVYEGFGGSVYTFQGDNEVDGDTRIDSWGANLSFAQELDAVSWTVGAGYISNLGDSDSLRDTVVDPTDFTGGWTANLAVVFQDFNLIGEYLGAIDEFNAGELDFDGNGAKPEAWNIELGYSFEVLGKESVAAVAYQGSNEALALELPEERWLVGWSIGIFDGTALSFEYSHDSDYSTGKGGTGEEANAFVAQLAVEF